MHHKKTNTIFRSAVIALSIILASSAGAAWAAPEPGLYTASAPWWEVTPEPETPSAHYDSIRYAEVAPMLREIELNTDRMKVEVIGQSAGGRNLFLATLTAAGDMKKLNYYRRFMKIMEHDPERALQMMDNGADFKVPFYINGSIHGDEYGGVDACIRLIKTLAYENTEDVQAILNNVILLINVVQNPDGRVLGTRENANGFDINRDFITQSQPETRATVNIIRQWNPITVLSLHDDVDPMLIEPCSPPHNPNYEYDLYIKWALREAFAMEDELKLQTGFDAQIPFRDWDFAAVGGWYWDDWPPIYDGMYPMYHGAFGHTLETPYEDIRGVDAHYAAVWGALNFVVRNKTKMARDRINIFWRGVHEKEQHLIPDDILAESNIDQFNEYTLKEFPAGYVIPAKAGQLSSHQPAELIDFLIFNGVQVEKSVHAFTLDGVEYPSGTYIVKLDQPKRSLANVILEDGPDVSPLSEIIESLVFYSPPTAWSLPLLWGIDRAVMNEKMDIQTVPVKSVEAPEGAVEPGSAGAYAFPPVNMAAYQAVNALLKQNTAVYRVESSFTDGGRNFGSGSFIIGPDAGIADELANHYALDLKILSRVPEGAILLREPKIAVMADAGVRWALKTMGFSFDKITAGDISNGGILEYDVFINTELAWPEMQLTADALAALREKGTVPEETLSLLEPLLGREFKRLDALFAALQELIGEEAFNQHGYAIAASAAGSETIMQDVENGLADLVSFFNQDGDYIGVLNNGIAFAAGAGWTSAADFSILWDCDAILNIDYAADCPVSAGFSPDGYALGLFPVVFSNVPDSVTVAASIDPSTAVASGYWPGWPDSGAAGKAVVLHEASGNRDVTLIGVNPSYRGHPKNTFRLIGNAIYTCIE